MKKTVSKITLCVACLAVAFYWNNRRVFDFDGNPIRKYSLDHPIYGIDVNEATHMIIATVVDSDEPIVEFKI